MIFVKDGVMRIKIISSCDTREVPIFCKMWICRDQILTNFGFAKCKQNTPSKLMYFYQRRKPNHCTLSSEEKVSIYANCDNMCKTCSEQATPAISVTMSSNTKWAGHALRKPSSFPSFLIYGMPTTPSQVKGKDQKDK